MQKPNSNKYRWIWSTVLVLFVCVAASTFTLVSRLGGFLIDDSGAIPLISENTSVTPSEDSSDETQSTSSTEQPASTELPTEEATQTSDTQSETISSTTVTTTPQVTQPPKNPGFEASDEQTVWSTNTQVEIFRISYVNGEQVITVNSDSGDKLIAPGTENSYTFKLKNTGNVALDYTVTVDSYFTPGDIVIPINGRLNRYDGKWIVGDKENYVNVPVLDTAEDKATLGAGKYTYYTLDWLWPFESGNDELDTMLGNHAVEQDLMFTVAITTTATESADPYDEGGITPPQTGDGSNLALWITLAIGSFAIMMCLIFYQGKEKRRSDAEAKKL